MERLTLIMCASMHRKKIHRYLTSKGQTLEPNSPLTIWAALCGNGVILGPYFFDGNVNGLAYPRMLNEVAFSQLAIHFNNQFCEGLFEVFGGHKMALQRIASLKYGIASMKYSERIVSLRFNIMWNGYLARLI